MSPHGGVVDLSSSEGCRGPVRSECLSTYSGGQPHLSRTSMSSAQGCRGPVHSECSGRLVAAMLFIEQQQSSAKLLSCVCLSWVVPWPRCTQAYLILGSVCGKRTCQYRTIFMRILSKVWCLTEPSRQNTTQKSTYRHNPKIGENQKWKFSFSHRK